MTSYIVYILYTVPASSNFYARTTNHKAPQGESQITWCVESDITKYAGMGHTTSETSHTEWVIRTSETSHTV